MIKGRNSINWFRSSDGAHRLAYLSRFVQDGIFATAEGGYGLVIALKGIDPECLSEQKIASISNSILQAQGLISGRISLFQTLLKRRCEVRASRYGTEADRNEFLRSRTFYEVCLYWTVYIHPAKKKVSDFSAESQAMLRELRECRSKLVSELFELSPSVLSAADALALFSYMARLQPSPFREPVGKQINTQLFDGSVAWHKPGLVFAEGTTRTRYAQPFSLAKLPEHPSPGMLSAILSIPGEFVIVLESRRQSAPSTQKQIKAHETFLGAFKHNPIALLVHRKSGETPKTAKSIAADSGIEMGGLAGILKDVTQLGKTYCTFSIIGLAHAPTEDGVRETMSALHRAFGASKISLLEEGYGALSAYQALFPGAVSPGVGHLSLNVRRRWIREDHLAKLSLWFGSETGSAYSETLEDESLAVFETRNSTPYHYDQFASGPRGELVIGEPRRGKTFRVNFLVDHEMKYGGYVFIFDVGGSYEHVVQKYNGTVIKIGLHGPRLNPFSLPDTEENRNQTARLVMLLLERGGARLRPQDETGIRNSVAAIYSLEDPRLRRLQYLILSPDLQPYLAKWIYGGIYADVFDNESDELRLARIVSFDFEGLSGPDQRVLMEPLLFWLRLRINSLIRAEGNLALPKLEVYDEVWRLIQDESVLAAIFETMKTAGKKLGGIILATQDTNDLGPHAGVIRNACPDATFLGGSFDREQYRQLFSMNDSQLDLIPTLKRGEMLLLRRHHAKVVQLVVDEHSKWLYSTHPQDVRRRNDAIREHGREKAFELLTAAGNSK